MSKDIIATDEICIHHHLEQTFIHELHDEGLIHLSIVNKQSFIPADDLPELEKMIHLHRDLEINVPGIASINHLMRQMDDLRNELWTLRNRLRMYED